MPEKSYILHARPYLEDSLLLHCLTEKSRVMIVARKARSAKSRWRGLLQPFQELWLEWRGRGQVMTLTQAEAQGRTFFFQGKILMAGLYINELVDRLLQKLEPESKLLALYADLLFNLSQQGEIVLEPLLRSFELDLLSCLGYSLPLTYQVNTDEKVRAEGFYRFHWQQGASLLFSQQKEQGISGQTLLSMQNKDWSKGQTLVEAKWLMRLIFNDILERRGLQSQTVFAMI